MIPREDLENCIYLVRISRALPFESTIEALSGDNMDTSEVRGGDCSKSSSQIGS